MDDSTTAPGAPPGAATPAAMVGSIAPIMVFLVLNRLAGLRWAVAGATVAGLGVAARRRRRNQSLGIVAPAIAFALVVRGVIGIATDSERVYFGLGIAGKFAIAAVLLASVAARRPLARRGARLLLQPNHQVESHPEWYRTMMLITAIGGLYYAASASLDTVLFARNSIEGFVILRFIANWPLTVIALAAASAVAQWRLSRIPGVTSALELIEEQLAARLGTNMESTETA